MSEKRLIKIPRQIRLKTEFFEGFGMEELIKTLIAGGISAVISYIFYKINIFIKFCTASLCFSASIPDTFSATKNLGFLSFKIFINS